MGNFTQISFQQTPALVKEMEEIDKLTEALWDFVHQIKKPQEYVKNYLEGSCGLEFQKYLNRWKAPLKILDIGCGRGETSLLLALNGHQVHSVEPSLSLCQIIDRVAKKFSLSIDVYQCVAEAIDQIPEEGFDVCLFNASFHHCDHPSKALAHCYAKLKKGGKIILLNEPILKSFHSKKWFEKRLEQFPEQMGHYGGNEHIYYYSEYIDFLSQARFSQIQTSCAARLYHPKRVLMEAIHLNVSDHHILLKYICLLLLKHMVNNSLLSKVVIPLFKKLSLLPVAFEGEK